MYLRLATGQTGTSWRRGKCTLYDVHFAERVDLVMSLALFTLDFGCSFRMHELAQAIDYCIVNSFIENLGSENAAYG